MKLTRLLPMLALFGSLMACGTADEPAVDQKQGAVTYSCGGANLSTQNPTMHNVVMIWTLPGITWHSNITLSTDLNNKNEVYGFASLEIDRPTENPAGTWPLFTSGIRINGSSIQAKMPAENAGSMYYFEGQTFVSGPFPGGSVSMSGLVYNGKHQLLGTFSTAVGVSGGVNQWLTGIPPVCASTSPQTLNTSFHYNLQLPGGTNWVQGTVTAQQNGAYVQLKLSDPHYQTHETWYGDAACVIDPSNQLQCNIHTGQDQFSGDIGDPIWTLKNLPNGWYYPYNKEWDYESTGLYIDFFGY